MEKKFQEFITEKDLQDPEKLKTFPIELTRQLRLFIFSDGSMTRNLTMVTNSKIATEVLKETEITDKGQIAKEAMIQQKDLDQLNTPLIQREVLLKDADGNILIYALSLFPKDQYELVMKNKKDAIGNNMTAAKLEYFREILGAAVVKDSAVASQMKSSETILLRNYFMYKGGKIMCYIVEYFSDYIINLVNPSK